MNRSRRVGGQQSADVWSLLAIQQLEGTEALDFTKSEARGLQSGHAGQRLFDELVQLRVSRRVDSVMRCEHIV